MFKSFTFCKNYKSLVPLTQAFLVSHCLLVYTIISIQCKCHTLIKREWFQLYSGLHGPYEIVDFIPLVFFFCYQVYTSGIFFFWLSSNVLHKPQYPIKIFIDILGINIVLGHYAESILCCQPIKVHHYYPIQFLPGWPFPIAYGHSILSG